MKNVPLVWAAANSFVGLLESSFDLLHPNVVISLPALVLVVLGIDFFVAVAVIFGKCLFRF